MPKKILVVDDDPDILMFNKNVVEQNGYEPLEASNGEEGMNVIKKELPDLIILDVLMPKESGIRLYRDIKTDPSFNKIPVIVVSGISKKSFLKSQKVLAEFGNQDVPEPEFYLEKPVEAKTLGDTIKKVIG